MNQEWVTIKEAAKQLNTGRNKISRLVQKGLIDTQDNPLDGRVKLVNLEQLRVLFQTYGSLESE
jgi:DNA-binding MarR family transcriptional regulator